MRHYHELRGGGHWDRASRPAGEPAGCYFLHRRDRWQSPDRSNPEGSGRASRAGDVRLPLLLHDQLPTPPILTTCYRSVTGGPTGLEVSAPTLRARVTQN